MQRAPVGEHPNRLADHRAPVGPGHGARHQRSEQGEREHDRRRAPRQANARGAAQREAQDRPRHEQVEQREPDHRQPGAQPGVLRGARRPGLVGPRQLGVALLLPHQVAEVLTGLRGLRPGGQRRLQRIVRERDGPPEPERVGPRRSAQQLDLHLPARERGEQGARLGGAHVQPRHEQRAPLRHVLEQRREPVGAPGPRIDPTHEDRAERGVAGRLGRGVLGRDRGHPQRRVVAVRAAGAALVLGPAVDAEQVALDREDGQPGEGALRDPLAIDAQLEQHLALRGHRQAHPPARAGRELHRCSRPRGVAPEREHLEAQRGAVPGVSQRDPDRGGEGGRKQVSVEPRARRLDQPGRVARRRRRRGGGLLLRPRGGEERDRQHRGERGPAAHRATPTIHTTSARSAEKARARSANTRTSSSRDGFPVAARKGVRHSMQRT